ncbi:cbb3-type cytochrome oxidase assembly protein CcoS [Pseudomonas sp. gcc21]|uniref:cbb3-type cytochrome oxidase assembly protein CcoS n=1 Tax=Pseudomonas sp. gcc21 TaxID=2726989 RepID=UPI0014511AA8|nr:cbb3-type cytochrome oxidase assembly protein CcoS [Pseudomonas sp. gcc21]QJD57792.1 cbb3-type cytochrome oxidase assembly protein CcoS [Pseudomonas sp. gcc21]
MTVLYILVPVAVVLVIVAIWVFNWAVNSGQYDDLDSPAHSILFDEDDPAHLAAQKRTTPEDDAPKPDSDDPERKT